MKSPCTIVTVERRLTAVINTAQRTARAKLAAILLSLDAGAAGPTCTRWTPPVGGTLPMEIGMIVARRFEANGDIVPSELPAGRAAHFSMKGSFENLAAAWPALFDWCKSEKLTLAGINWEIYGATEDAELYALLA